MEKAAFNRKNTFFNQQIGLKLRKKLAKLYSVSIVLYSAGIGTLRKAKHKCLEVFETWCWRRMEKIVCAGRVRNEEVYIESRRKGISYIQ